MSDCSPKSQSNYIEEVWKDIPKYEGFYEISNHGRIRSVTRTVTFTDSRKRTWKAKIKNLKKAKNGYYMTQLYKNGKFESFYVHHLVLLAFVGPCPEGMQCRHFPDNNRTNNNIWNISWNTSAQDAQDKITMNTIPRGETHINSKLTEKQVREIRHLYSTKQYLMKDIAKIYNVSTTTIVFIINKKRWGWLN